MTTLGARAGFWIILVLIGMGVGGWFMFGQVTDSRKRAETAEQQVIDLGKRLEEIAARQAQTDAILATRRRQSDALTTQLGQLRSDLQKVMTDDPKSNAWGADCVPSAVADRLRLPADSACSP